MIQLFNAGNPVIMGILTLILISLFLAAWRAPAWVKEIGLVALVFGVAMQLYGLFIACSAVIAMPDISFIAIVGAFRISLVSIIYGVTIYLVSLIVRIVHKPRI